ncbi:alpha-ketoglutarate-dependent dioxygenase alkB homolog 6 [Lutzomyia longipalpis]|uniref:alpha-ketoglutarate-dependent dioxygenase alkB homolog 6 n=1 Tax=Lutzomyia longipalpis TaxID=7200 RepID=UPI002483E0D1|nr:alpha-ketoglutarate-dependent dioxygenase alkB homolog 6 [Lutzomyia longipalpis]
MDYSEFIVTQCPQTVIYIPNFITSDEEKYILSCVAAAPKPKWTQLLNRRLINYGGVPHKNGMIAEEMPVWLQTFVEKINNLGVLEDKKANHVLVNEYLPGQGIMPHTDGPLFHPVISTISCGSHTILRLQKMAPTSAGNESVEDDSQAVQEILVEPRSLLLIKDKAYHEHMHSIEELLEDRIDEAVMNLSLCEKSYSPGTILARSRRISLTIRHVPKTSKMKIKLGF